MAETLTITKNCIVSNRGSEGHGVGSYRDD